MKGKDMKSLANGVTELEAAVVMKLELMISPFSFGK